MKVILSKDVPSLGKVGDLVRVADGYARNFLLPNRMAMEATEKRIKEFKHLTSVAEAKKKKAVAAAHKVADTMKAHVVTLMVKVGENDKLYGSITNADVAKKLREGGFVVDRRDIHIEEPIRQLGQYKVKVRLATGVDAEVKVVVDREA